MNTTTSINPLAWVHFQLRGGWKRSILLTLGGCIVLGALMMLSIVQSRAAQGYSGAMEGWAQGLLVLEGAILILYGAGAVAQSIRNDVIGGVIESHRLMPISAPRAVIGYLLGGGGGALVMALGAMGLSLFAALASRVSLDRWLIAQCALAVLTLLIWLLVAMGAFTGRVGGGLILVLVVVGFFSGGYAFLYFPGLVILVVPTFERLNLFTGGQAEVLLPLGLVIQAALIVLFFIASVRRYARDDLTCLGVVPALGLAATWVGMSLMGMHHYSTLVTWGYDRMSVSSQCVSSLAVLMLLSVLPLANASRRAASASTSLTPARDRLGPLVVIVACLALAALFALIVYRPWHLSSMAPLQTLVIVAAWLLAMRYLLGWVYKAVDGGFMIGVVWTLLIWFGPMVGDVILQSVQHPNDNYAAGALFAVSPLGALMQVWPQSTANTSMNITIGLAVQIGLILIPLLLFTQRGRKPRLMKPAGAV